ncbi:MAG: peptidylprolyl isomerase [Bacteroidota bacterium]
MKRYSFLFILLFIMTINESEAQKNKKDQLVKISTTLGDIVVLLYDATPQHKANFLKLVEEGTYNSTLFHRIIKDFMIQGGDPESKDPAKKNAWGTGGLGYTIEAEILPGYIHKKGVLAAARQGDAVNPEKRSSSCQFYIVQGKPVKEAELKMMENRLSQITGQAFTYSEEEKKAYMEEGGSPWLDQQYTIFGEVIDGLALVDTIAAVKTGPRDVPVEPITMTMEVLELRKKKIEKLYDFQYPEEE